MIQNVLLSLLYLSAAAAVMWGARRIPVPTFAEAGGAPIALRAANGLARVVVAGVSAASMVAAALFAAFVCLLLVLTLLGANLSFCGCPS